MKNCILLSLLFISTQLFAQTSQQQMHLNDKEYPECQCVNVMADIKLPVNEPRLTMSPSDRAIPA